MSKSYWLVKQEPEAYAWSQFVADGTTAWTGVRNFQARNHLRTMALGDWVLYYHSVSEKRIVGIAEVVREAYPDPTADDGDWSCVDLRPIVPITQPVELQVLRADKVTAEMALIRQSRLSVMPVTDAQMQRILELGGTELPKVKR
jgi:predicted RNA-binding protein with PUA-like domain